MSILFEIQKIQRIENSEKIKISGPSNVYNIPHIQEIKDATQEHLIVMTLNKKNIVTTIELIAVGKTGSINIDLKDVIRPAIIQGSSGIIIVHNHPSGYVDPSKQDIEFSMRVSELSRLFNIELMDHIIVGQGYLSMREMGYFEKNNFDKVKISNEAIDELKLENTRLINEINKQDEKILILENKIKKYSKKIFLDNEMEL